MLAAVLILVFTLFIVFYIPHYSRRKEEEFEREEEEDPNKKNPQIKKLWSLAQTAIKERKPLKAEKALLTILKFDEKNAAAYNRLGIIYAHEKHYKEAIECFEIAQSLDNNPSSLHNVGLIYFETGKYEQAVMAFQQAIEIEGDQPGRYIALAKAQEKLGNRKQAIESLETAYELMPSTTTLRHLLEIYENAEDKVNIEITKERIANLLTAKKRRAPSKEEREKARSEAKAKRTAAKTQRVAARTQKTEARKTAKAAKAAARTQKHKKI